MAINWNEFRNNIKFLVALYRPSLAKALSVPLLLTGLAILNPPLWLELINWLISQQELFPEFSQPISKSNEPYGWVFIALSIFIYLVDVYRQIKAMRHGSENNFLDRVEKYPEETAALVAEKLQNTGFTGQHLQNEKIEALVREITLLRFFSSYPKESKSIALAESILNGELSGGSSEVKARALAQLARYLSVSEKIEYAQKCLLTSKKLCQTPEAKIAEAFISAIGSKDVKSAVNLNSDNTAPSYSALFMIKRSIEGNGAALDWLDRANLTPKDIDNDGVVALVSALLSEHQWEKALNITENLDDSTLTMSPALTQLSAFSFLVNAIQAVELRRSVMNSVPFAADKFPLADDLRSIELRKRSTEMFKLCSALVRELGNEDIAKASDSYAMWLELRDNDTHQKAKLELQKHFTNYTQYTLEYLPLALAFGIDIDLESIEKEVNKQTALSNDDDATLGLARFVLAQTKNSFPETLEYLSRHRKQIEGAVNPTAISMLEIEALARSGLVEDAKTLLQKMEASGAPDAEATKLKSIIDSVKGKDPIALAIKQYRNSKSTGDLYHLVDLLEKEKLGDKYYSYCKELFDRTGQEADAIRLCNAASALERFTELHQFLSDRMSLVKRSEGLQVHWAWSLFRMGNLNDANEQITLLKRSRSQQADLVPLQINLSIFSGDWESLSVFVEEIWRTKNELNASNLLQAVHLAKAVSPGRAKQMLEFCAEQYPEDPQVLASSYFTATQLGWDERQEASEWLNRAITLSDDEGPLHRASLEDLRAMMDEAKEKNERVYKAYYDGSAPISTVAELLNRTMSDFYLIQPLENVVNNDIRRKSLVPIFSGARLDQITGVETIAIDASSALVAENLGLLPVIFNCFEKIVIPHSFMHWLFEEKQKVAFHQPSQIEKAKYFERLVSDGKISILPPKKISNPELATDVGDELASMLERTLSNLANESPTLVVRSCPVYKVGRAFNEVEADLTTFHHCLVSCSQLIKSLKNMAVITEAQCLKALHYLNQHEKEWPSEPEIAKGTKLFLDSLSVAYLMAVNVLDKLSDAGLEVYVSKGERDRYKSLVNYDATIKKADLKIENIRNHFSNGLSSGKVTLASMPLSRQRVSSLDKRSPRLTEDIFEAIKICDAALIDDRFINRHQKITFDDITVPIFTSLDLLETLHEKELISNVEKFDFRNSLRELGFEFVGISYEELEHHLNDSVLADGQFEPTRQLRILKESLLLVRISGLIKLPRDAQWLTKTIGTIAKAIKQQWSADIPVELKRARSSWLYELMSYREWAQAHQTRGDDGMAYMGEVLRASSLLMAPESLSGEQRDAYKKWLDDYVLTPLKYLDPLSFENLVNSIKQQVKRVYQSSDLEDIFDD